MKTELTLLNESLFEKGLKKCSKCLEVKALSCYTKQNETHKGVRPLCKMCHNMKGRHYYHRDIEKNLNRRRQRYSHTVKDIHYRFLRWRMGAKTRKIEWLLDEKDLLQIPLVCFYTQIELTFETNCYNTVSLDRIDSSKGYIPGNVVFCCYMINSMKMDYGLQQFVDMCKKVADNASFILTEEHK